MAFGAKHNYSSLVLQSAPLLVNTPLPELVQLLQPSVYIEWVRCRRFDGENSDADYLDSLSRKLGRSM